MSSFATCLAVPVFTKALESENPQAIQKEADHLMRCIAEERFEFFRQSLFMMLTSSWEVLAKKGQCNDGKLPSYFVDVVTQAYQKAFPKASQNRTRIFEDRMNSAKELFDFEPPLITKEPEETKIMQTPVPPRQRRRFH